MFVFHGMSIVSRSHMSMKCDGAPAKTGDCILMLLVMQVEVYGAGAPHQNAVRHHLSLMRTCKHRLGSQGPSLSCCTWLTRLQPSLLMSPVSPHLYSCSALQAAERAQKSYL